MAAILGRRVDHQEWHRACEILAITPPTRVVTALVERGMVELSDQGFVFAHPLLVESLHRQSREHHRWKAYHRGCAIALEERVRGGARQMGHRAGEHWIHAGELERALFPLAEAEEQLFSVGQTQEALAVLERLRQVLDLLEMAQDHPLRLRSEVRVVQYDWVAGRSREAMDRVQTALARCTRPEHDACAARLLRFASLCHARFGDLQSAEECARRGLEKTRATRDLFLLGDAHSRLSRVLLLLGRRDESEDHLREAIRHYQEGGFIKDYLWATMDLAWLEVDKGVTESALRTLEATRREAQRQGMLRLESNCINALGTVAIAEERYQDARDFFRQFLRIETDLEDIEGQAVANINLGNLAIRLDHDEEAHAHLDRAAAFASQASLRSFEFHLRLFRLVLATRADHEAEALELLSPFLDQWPVDAPTDEELLWALELAADHARHRDLASIARICDARADDLRRALHQARHP